MLWDKLRRRPRPDAEPNPPTIAASHPSSYSHEIELALIAAVYSAAGGEDEPAADPLTVRVVVDRWHRHRAGKPADSLSHISSLDDHAFCRVLDDRTRLGGRPRSCVIQDAADRLLEAGISCAADLAADPLRASRQLEQVRGLEARAIGQLFQLLELPHSTAA
ncbi:hypothetical protein GC722_00415 [Auraticoccus sp. F435]|uniref:Uncharacterized protein n=1 Tax=Auraticoccus cholistanensis TaxID=2656650 RepID=A0A6A9US15_9ACTN|nr:hypothetical protein [Auraticoccus cholistanensis]MVA74505.1 hypothetical protein [Auraticoccus cholistanensis]